MHPLYEALVAAAGGRFPPVDGEVEVYRPTPDGPHVVHEFTGHAIVLTDRDPAALRALGADGFGGVTKPDVLRWLAGTTGTIGSHDALLVAQGRGRDALPHRSDLHDHPRVVRALRYRADAEVFGDGRGLVTIGHGLVGRCEMSVELLAAEPGHGAGRALIDAGLDTVAEGELVWAQVAPGNAASLRAFLSCGFRPIGAEVLIERDPDRPSAAQRPIC